MTPKRLHAVIVILCAVALDVGGGLWFAHLEHVSSGLGLYFAVTVATTVGFGDITAHTVAGHWIAVAMMLTVIPLFAATFSLLTTGLTATHVRRHVGDLRMRMEAHHAEAQRLACAHHAEHMAALKVVTEKATPAKKATAKKAPAKKARQR